MSLYQERAVALVRAIDTGIGVVIGHAPGVDLTGGYRGVRGNIYERDDDQRGGQMTPRAPLVVPSKKTVHR